jgi:hypothetical protein
MFRFDQIIHPSMTLREVKQMHLETIPVLEQLGFKSSCDDCTIETACRRTRIPLRDLVETTNDPFIKRRLLALMSRYDDGVTARTPLTPVDLKVQSQSTG